MFKKTEAVRNTARAIVINQDKRVLLIKIDDQSVGTVKKAKWITPGGKMESDETPESAVKREIKEETGFEQYELGPEIWCGTHTLVWKNIPTKLTEHFFLVNVVTGSDEINTSQMEDEERSVFKKHYWWSMEELQQTDEIILPPAMIDLLPEILAGQVPNSPRPIDLRTKEEREEEKKLEKGAATTLKI